MPCIVPDCGRPVRCKGLCSVHYDRKRHNGHTNLTRRSSGTFTVRPDGRIMITRDGKQVLEHIFIAEQALGRPLPKGAPVHHVDYDPANNAKTNLVICPTYKYHHLLHVRTNALNACGNANWRKCGFCKNYDAPENLCRRKGTETFHHTECQVAYLVAWREQKRKGAAP